MRTNNNPDLFIKAEQSGALLGALYRARKSENKRFSLQYLCSRAKVASKGYLSDVIVGRRKLNTRFARGLADAFDLDGTERKIFVYLIQMENERSLAKQQLIVKKIRALKDQLKSGLRDVPENVNSPVLFTRVFCSLGVFSSPPTKVEIVNLLKDERPASVTSIIDLLIQSGAVIELDGRLSVASSEIRFGNGSGPDTNIRYIEEFLSFTKMHVQNWYHKKNESFFESSMLSVRKDRYLEVLPKIKEMIDQTLSDLEEASNADELIHFGIQIFPDSIKRPAKG